MATHEEQIPPIEEKFAEFIHLANSCTTEFAPEIQHEDSHRSYILLVPQILTHTHYSIQFDTSTKIPLWTKVAISQVNATKALNTKAPPRPTWSQDPLLNATDQAKDSDYNKSGYDRGHLVPAEPFTYDLTAFKDTFVMTNCAPQLHTANQNWWNQAESFALHAAYYKGDLVIETMTVGNVGTIVGTNNVGIPAWFCKALCHTATGKTVGFFVLNSGTDLNVGYTTVDDLEKKTKYKIFTGITLCDKKNIDKAFWNLK